MNRDNTPLYGDNFFRGCVRLLRTRDKSTKKGTRCMDLSSRSQSINLCEHKSLILRTCVGVSR